jgi:hypothetical protein
LRQRRGLKKPWAGEEENKNALPGCVWVSSPKRLEQPHAELVHWWLLVHFSPFFASHSSAKKPCNPVFNVLQFFQKKK